MQISTITTFNQSTWTSVSCIGVRDQFRLGGPEVSCPNIFSIACPKIKWFCPNITWFFCPNMAIWKIPGGAAAPPPPPPPASYAYGFLWKYCHHNSVLHQGITNPLVHLTGARDKTAGQASIYLNFPHVRKCEVFRLEITYFLFIYRSI